MSSDSRTDDLLMRWNEEFSRGHDVTIDDLCRECPELGPAIADEIAKLKKMHRVLEPATYAEKNSAPLIADGLRYLPVGFHARGALGEVYLARDQEVGRDVALKVMQVHLAEHEDSRLRFVREAEITGRLEHPGIVPIYGMGEDAAGQPFYAMRFIRGESLRDAIVAFHTANGSANDADKRQRGLRELVSRLVAVCNAAAYAHSRGIVHRDIKPANVMLGNFGETLLVDWGLARPFQRTAEERAVGEETLRPATALGEGSTQVGSAAGTPAYMSPEQANGLWNQVGPASDIFCLGATLYHIATGTTPYEGSKALQLAQRGQFLEPRQRDKRVPKALNAICLKAMAVTPEQRYASAKEMAADLERWLGDEPVSAYREPLWERGRRWMRKHRALVTSSVAVLLVSILLLAGFTALLAKAYDHELQISSLLNEAYTNQRQISFDLEQEKKRTELALQERDDQLKAAELARAEMLKERKRAASATDLVLIFVRDSGGMKDAEFLDAVVDKIEREYPADSPIRSDLLAGIGKKFVEKVPAKAIPLLKQYYDRHALQEPDEPETLDVASFLAWAYYSTRQYDLAEPIYQHWLMAMEPPAPGDELRVAYRQNLLGECQVMLGKFEQAETQLRKSLEGYQAKAPTAELRYDTESLLGAALAGQKKFAEAEPLALASYNGLQGMNPPAGRYLLISALLRVIDLYDAWEKPADAAKWRAKAYDLAESYYTKRFYPETERLLVSWLKAPPVRTPKEDLKVALVENLVGESQVMLSKYVEAENHLKASLEIYKKQAPAAMLRFDTESLLGASLAGQKKFADAEPLALAGYNGLKAMEPKLNEGSKNLVRSALNRVIDLYTAWGKKEEAAKWRTIRDTKASPPSEPDDARRFRDKLQSLRQTPHQEPGNMPLRMVHLASNQPVPTRRLDG